MKTKQRTSYSIFQLSTPYEEKQLKLSQLQSGNAYQRPLKNRVVKRIIDTFDPKLFDEVIVSFRDNKYNVVDGQHRIQALRIMNGGKDASITCKVITGLTYEQEADLYNRLDASKTKLTVADKTRAIAESGKDPDVNAIRGILEANGIEWVFKAQGGGAATNKINATRTLLNAYSTLGYAGFSQMIRLLKNTWNGSADSLNLYIISGMALFVKTYGAELNEKAFIEKLSKCDPKEIVRMGRVNLNPNSALRYANVILLKYNYRTKNALKYYKMVD